MTVYFVSWNLKLDRPNYKQDHEDFLHHLEKLEHTKDAGFESVRWVSTTCTPDDLRGYLEQKMDGDDCLFLAQLRTGAHDGLLDEQVWDWIRARL